MAREIDSSTPAGRCFLIVVGIAFIGMMVFPFACRENGGCVLGIATPWSAMSWVGKAAISIFVTAGLIMILQGVGLNTLARLGGLVLVVLFGAMLNALFLGLREPACGPMIGLIRTLAEVPPYPACRLWPTLAALWIDLFFIGFALELTRKQFAPESLREPLRRWTQGILLAGVSPMLLLLLVLLVPTIGSAIVKERWQQWRK